MPVSQSIKNSVESKLRTLLKKGAKFDRDELAVVNAAIKYLAVSAKLDESSYGVDLDKLIEEDEEKGEDNESGDDN